MTDMIGLKEWDWDNQRYMEREYPLAIVKRFVERVRSFNKDRDVEWILKYASDLERDLTDYRNEQANLAAEAAKSARCKETTRSGERCKRDAVEDGICAVHRTAREAAMVGTN